MEGQSSDQLVAADWNEAVVDYTTHREPVLNTETATHTTPTVEKQNASTSYRSTSVRTPYEQPKYTELREIIRGEIMDTWMRKTNVLETFFPHQEESSEIFQKLRELQYVDHETQNMHPYYGAVDRLSKKIPFARPGIQGRPPMLREGLREGWTQMPSPQKDGEESVGEKDITAAFVPIINHIIRLLGCHDTRVAIDRQDFPIKISDGNMLRPDVFLWRKGSPAFPPANGIPPPVTTTQKEKAAAIKAGQPVQESPAVDWPWCVIPIEVKTEVNRGATKNTTTFCQLGTYVRDVFAAQKNRRFVPSLVITECTAEFLLWDRAGVLISERFDYHIKPLLFCHMLVNLVKWDDERLGFDPTVFYRGDQMFIRTKETVGNAILDVEYAIEVTLERSYTILGRGSTSWRVRKPGDDTNRYIVQDSWLKNGMAEEQKIIRSIEGARARGIPGVPCYLHMEEVIIPGEHPSQDTVKNNRRDPRFSGTLNLIHTRSVSRCRRDCTPLNNFTSPQELINSLRDVVRALRDLYIKARVIHRDIAPWNILMQRGAPEGERGILIGFSCGALVSSPTFSPRTELTPGSYLYRTRNALLGQVESAHLDDLECFYYLLCFLIVGHDGPQIATGSPTSAGINGWLSKVPDAATEAKHGHISRRFRLVVKDWYNPVKIIAKNLHGFFHRRIVQDGSDQDDADQDDAFQDAVQPTPKSFEEFLVQSDSDFEEFLARFDDTFRENEALSRSGAGFIGPSLNSTYNELGGKFTTSLKRGVESLGETNEPPPKRTKLSCGKRLLAYPFF